MAYSLGSDRWLQIAAGEVALAVCASLGSKQLGIVTAAPALSPGALPTLFSLTIAIGRSFSC